MATDAEWEAAGRRLTERFDSEDPKTRARVTHNVMVPHVLTEPLVCQGVRCGLLVPTGYTLTLVWNRSRFMRDVNDPKNRAYLCERCVERLLLSGAAVMEIPGLILQVKPRKYDDEGKYEPW